MIWQARGGREAKKNSAWRGFDLGFCLVNVPLPLMHAQACGGRSLRIGIGSSSGRFLDCVALRTATFAVPVDVESVLKSAKEHLRIIR